MRPGRFPARALHSGASGLCPLVRQSGNRDVRGPLAKNGPKYLRWALIEAATHAARHPVYREPFERTKQRLGRQRGAKVARVDIARKLAEAIWHVLTKHEPFAPAGPTIVRSDPDRCDDEPGRTALRRAANASIDAA